jgi:preprotein translocase subunit SecF
MQFIRPGTQFDFVGKRKLAAIISTLLVVASMVLFFVKGPNWGIDFTGGTEIELHFEKPTSIDEVRSAVGQLGLASDTIQQVGDQQKSAYIIRIQDTTFGTERLRGEVENALEARFGAEWIQESSFDAQVGARLRVRYAGASLDKATISEALVGVPGAAVGESPDENVVEINLPGMTSELGRTIETVFPERGLQMDRVDAVGPKVGGELRQKAFLSLFAALVLVLVYVGFRFDLAFAPGAIIALFHDVAIVVGVFVLFGVEFNLSIIGALLTIIGYSLNDTIIIYDRIRENMRRYRRGETLQLINDAVNETLGRTLSTNFSTIMAVAAFIFLGGPVIQTFAVAMVLGVFVGTYSTIYVASPTILVMEDLRPYISKVFAPLMERVNAEPAPSTLEAEKVASAAPAELPGALVPTTPAPPAPTGPAVEAEPVAELSESAKRRLERKRLREASSRSGGDV